MKDLIPEEDDCEIFSEPVIYVTESGKKVVVIYEITD